MRMQKIVDLVMMLITIGCPWLIPEYGITIVIQIWIATLMFTVLFTSYRILQKINYKLLEEK